MRLSALLVLLPVVAHAQDRVPAGWESRLDQPATLVSADSLPPGTWRFTEMPPGMHVTAGPGVLLYPAADRAPERYVLEGEFFFFPDSRGEGHGVFFGGRDLGQATETWLAFLVDGNGRYAVVQHVKGSTAAVVPWADGGTVIHRRGSDDANRLRVSVEPDSIRFSVNDTRVAGIARRGEMGGFFGVRVEADVNLHVTNVDLTRRYLKARGQR